MTNALKNYRTIVLIMQLLAGAGVSAQQNDGSKNELQMLADHVFDLSEVMLHDATNPPAASRAYAYATFGAYQAASMAKGRVPALNQKLHTDPNIRLVTVPKKIDVSFCSNYAMLEIGRALMPSGYLLEKKKAALAEECKKQNKYSDREMTQQVRYAMEVAAQVIEYAKKDGYNKLSTYTRYTPKKGEGYWYPTPPAYMAAVEPRWETVRPFFLDSASQFAPPPPEIGRASCRESV